MDVFISGWLEHAFWIEGRIKVKYSYNDVSLESGLGLKLFMTVTEDLNEYIELSLSLSHSCKFSAYAIISVIYRYTQLRTLILNIDFRNIS